MRGCPSRFSRQDNMMQHYRTHTSSKSRRGSKTGQQGGGRTVASSYMTDSSINEYPSTPPNRHIDVNISQQQQLDVEHHPSRFINEYSDHRFQNINNYSFSHFINSNYASPLQPPAYYEPSSVSAFRPI